MCERKGGGERVQLQVLSVVSLLSKKKKKPSPHKIVCWMPGEMPQRWY